MVTFSTMQGEGPSMVTRSVITFSWFPRFRRGTIGGWCIIILPERFLQIAERFILKDFCDLQNFLNSQSEN